VGRHPMPTMSGWYRCLRRSRFSRRPGGETSGEKPLALQDRGFSDIVGKGLPTYGEVLARLRWGGIRCRRCRDGIVDFGGREFPWRGGGEASGENPRALRDRGFADIVGKGLPTYGEALARLRWVGIRCR